MWNMIKENVRMGPKGGNNSWRYNLDKHTKSMEINELHKDIKSPGLCLSNDCHATF